MAASTNRYDNPSFQFRLITAAPKGTELTGAVDLLSYYGMKELHDKFCQKPLPVLIGENRYLKDVVGDIDIWKGEGMELEQLMGVANEDINVHLHEFDVAVLQRAFCLRESGPMYLPKIERGVPTSTNKLQAGLKNEDTKHKDQHKGRVKDKGKDNFNSREKENKKIREKSHSKKKDIGEDNSRKHHKKKRKHDGEEDQVHKHNEAHLHGDLW